MEQIDKISFEDYTLLNTGSQLVLEDLEELPLQASCTKALLTLLEHCEGKSLPSPNSKAIRELTLFLVDGQKKPLSLYNEESGFSLSDGKKTIALSREQADILLRQTEDYAEPNILSLSLPKEGHFLISGRLHKEALQFSYNTEDGERIALLTAPETADISEEELSPILSSLSDLRANQVCVIAPDPVDLQAYGLSVPFCIFHGDLYGESFTLSVSQPDETGHVYLMKEGTPLIYQARVTQLPWLTACKESLTEKNIFSANYEDSTAFSISAPNFQYRFTKWQGQVLCQGKSIYEPDFYQLYRLATTLIPSQAALPSPQGTILLSVEISYTNPVKGSDCILFYDYDEENVLLSLNGDKRFLMEKEQVEEIISAVNSLI